MTIGNFDENLIDEVMDEVDFGSDRATAIVLAAFVEDHLSQFIRSRLTKDERTSASNNECLGQARPLGILD
jgi:hypothetical protein